MKIAQATPELPVKDVRAAQEYYRDHLGFQIEWHHAAGDLGAVSHGAAAIFLRKTSKKIHPATFWIFAQDIDAAFAELTEKGADIIDQLEDKPWGMRQFTVRDLHDNRFHFHHDL